MADYDDTLNLDNSPNVDDNYDPDDPENYSSVDDMVAAVTGNEPEPGEAYSLAEEMASDEADRWEIENNTI